VPLFAPEMKAGDGSDADYTHGDLDAAEARHFWFRSRRRSVLWALRRYFPAARRLIDVGCGTGFMIEALGAASGSDNLVATDVFFPFLQYASRRLRPPAEVLQADARRLPFRDEFDVAGAFDVIEHVDDDGAVLAEVRRTLKPGGGLIVTVPQHRWLWSTVDEFSRHRRRYTRSELVARVTEAGFDVLDATSLFALTLPLLMLARLRRVPLERFDPASELKIAALPNAVLDGMLRAEEAAVRMGLRLPAGGSLLLVARRRG